MIKQKYKIILFIFLFSPLAYSAANWDQHATKVFIYQVINVTLLLGGMIYFLRQPVRNFFQSRAEKYYSEAQKAQQELLEVQNELFDLQKKITKLETTWNDTILRAQKDAIDYKKQLISQSQEQSHQMVEDLKRLIQIEHNRLAQKIKQDLINEIYRLVENRIKTQLTTEQHRTLQAKFYELIEEKSP